MNLRDCSKEIITDFDLGGFGSMIGGVVGGMFGGPIGAQIGSMIGGQIGHMLSGMINDFGMENVAGGLANCINQNAASIANQHVTNSGLPQFLQDELKEFIGNWLNENMQDVPSDCQSSCVGVYNQVNESNSTEGFRNAQNKAMRCNAENEAEDSKEGKTTKGNWLVALAGALAEVQGEFLTAAMKNMETMRENSNKATQGTPPKNESPQAKETRQKAEEKARNEFLMAQSQYQANMQMFNMVANMTATSLKSLGEGMTAIARKQ